MSFELRREQQDLQVRPARLAHRDIIAANFVRIRLEGESLGDFDSPGADDHMRLFFPGEASLAGSLDELRELPSREYTPLAWDNDERWLDVEFLIHGDDGIAGVWARDAPIGSQVAVAGPRGSQLLDGTPDHWMLAGDETAVPAIRRWLHAAGPQAHGRVAIEVADPDHHIPVDAGPEMSVDYVYRSGGPAGAALARWLQDRAGEPVPAGAVFCFIAAESGIVPVGRHLLKRWNIDPTSAVVKGYWRSGTSEYHAPH